MVTSKEWSAEWNSLDDEVKQIIRREQSEVPVALGRIAAIFGIEVKVATLDIGISGEIAPKENSDQYRIRINRHEVKPRQRFTLAHEISHYLLHRELINDGIYDTVLYRSQLSNEIEIEANKLAADILMPKDKIREWMKFNPNKTKRECLFQLADFFDVSEDAMAIRLGLKK